MKSNFLDNSVAIHKSRPPLRWFANWAGDLASRGLLDISYMEENAYTGWKYKVNLFIWNNFWPIYYRWGTTYTLDMDLSGPEWDDYDENGVPYWEKWIDWDFEDEVTGDAFRIIEKSGYGTMQKLEDEDYRGNITPFLGKNI